MKNIVLVHDILGGTWCWRKTEKILKDKQFMTKSVALPGGGSDAQVVGSMTMEKQVEAIEAQTKDLAHFTLVVQGMSATAAAHFAEKWPAKVDNIIFLSGVLVPKGKSFADEAIHNKDAALAKKIAIGADRKHFTVAAADLRRVFYTDCDEHDWQMVAKVHPLAGTYHPNTVPWRVSEQNFGTIPKYYVECLNDQALNLAFQRHAQHSWPLARVFTLKTDHAVFFNANNDLCNIIKEVAMHHHAPRRHAA